MSLLTSNHCSKQLQILWPYLMNCKSYSFGNFVDLERNVKIVQTINEQSWVDLYRASNALLYMHKLYNSYLQ
uniref:Uncharacterized protein n=1 Tax=Rhizophora mucronata TaxID=61149 RepID=A0A2P2PN46_RHIMU